jgi:GTP-binding protein Era
MVNGHGRAHHQIAHGQIHHHLASLAQGSQQRFWLAIEQGNLAGHGHHEEAPGAIPVADQVCHPIRQHLVAEFSRLPAAQPAGAQLHRLHEAILAWRGGLFSHGAPVAGSVEVMEFSSRSEAAPGPLAAHLPDDFRSGFVALIGRPNVGKSTLLNQLVGQKVAITSPLAQTTRNRLRGIVTTDRAQLVLLDTPGIHKPHHLLGQRLVQSARGAIGEVDLVLLLLDGSQPAGRGDAFIVNLLRHSGQPVQVALNKIDQAGGDAAAMGASYTALLEAEGDPSWPVHACSALTGAGCDPLLRALASALPIGPHLYPPGEVSDQPEQLLLAELIREQVLHHTREEVPHSVAVRIERIVEDAPPGATSSRTAILATVLVERASQKAILIGRGGSMLRCIGQGARLQMQKLFDGPIYLELFIKVVPNWRRHPGRLAELGYRGD